MSDKNFEAATTAGFKRKDDLLTGKDHRESNTCKADYRRPVDTGIADISITV